MYVAYVSHIVSYVANYPATMLWRARWDPTFIVLGNNHVVTVGLRAGSGIGRVMLVTRVGDMHPDGGCPNSPLRVGSWARTVVRAGVAGTLLVLLTVQLRANSEGSCVAAASRPAFSPCSLAL